MEFPGVRVALTQALIGALVTLAHFGHQASTKHSGQSETR
jgi:uncharacterized MnhB-related membrane protein